MKRTFTDKGGLGEANKGGDAVTRVRRKSWKEAIGNFRADNQYNQSVTQSINQSSISGLFHYILFSQLAN